MRRRWQAWQTLDVHFNLPAWGGIKPEPSEEISLGMCLALTSALSRCDFLPGVGQASITRSLLVTKVDLHHSSVQNVGLLTVS
jgi:hypothetical protein